MRLHYLKVVKLLGALLIFLSVKLIEVYNKLVDHRQNQKIKLLAVASTKKDAAIAAAKKRAIQAAAVVMQLQEKVVSTEQKQSVRFQGLTNKISKL